MAARTVLLLALCAVAAAQEAQEIYFGKLQVVAVHGRDKSDRRGDAPRNKLVEHEHHLNLVTKEGALLRLLLPVELEETTTPRSGAHVLVKGQAMARCSLEKQRPGTICVAQMMVHEAAPKDIYATGQPRGEVHIKTLVMQLDVCGWGIAQKNWDALEGAVWSGLPHSQNLTVESLMGGCSFGMGHMSKSADGGHLLRVPVPIPCNGTTPHGIAYNSQECPFPEWSHVANDWVKKNRPEIKLSDWPHKVYVVPKGDVCGWGGMGYVGCKDDCRVWINGDLWKEPDTYFHELGHNLYMNHAGKWGNSGYDDMSGAMGYCCDIRCHNAPHAHQVGWAAPVATLHSGNFPSGTWQSFTLPAAALEPRNFLTIWPDWDKTGAKSRIYLQYRKRIGFDFGIDKAGSFGDRVIVYSAAANDPQPYTSWEAGVDAGQQWRESRLGTSLIIRVPSYDAAAGTALVRVCWWAERNETSCGDGLDNDCDGKIDGEDPDCAHAPAARLESGHAARARVPAPSFFNWFG